MSQIPQPSSIARVLAPPLRPKPPAWVATLFSGAAAPVDHPGRCGRQLTVCSTDRFSLISAAIDDSTDLSADELIAAVSDAYRSLAAELARERRYPVRLWNFVSDIQGRLGEGDRYMAFNAGRFAAYCDWFGGAGAFMHALPTSSAVGVSGDALWVYVLAADEAGVPFDNPRQTPPYLYSRRYGRRPPCFARATKLGSRLLIGGTASILGEDTRHEDDIEAQTRETFANIESLVARASGWPANRALEGLRCLRVHVLHADDALIVRELMDDLAPHVREVEFVQAPLCRRELLVEIEGTAECP